MRQTERYETVDFQDGITVAKRNITGTFTLNEATKNVTFGNRDGIGPRYGTAPIPYHTHTQTVSNTLSGYNIRTSEAAAPNAALHDRTRYLFTVSFTARLNDGIVSPSTQKVYIICNQTDYQYSGADLHNVHLSVLGTTDVRAIGSGETYRGYQTASGGVPAGLGGNFTRHIPAATLSAGLDALNQETVLTNELTRVGGTVNSTPTFTTTFFTGTQRLGTNANAMSALSQVRYARQSTITVTGREYTIGQCLALLSPSKAPVTSSPGNPGDLSLALTGNPNGYFYGDEPENRGTRSFSLLELNSGAWMILYSYTYDNLSDLARKPTKDMLWVDASYSFTDTTATTSITPPVSAADACYFEDDTLKHTGKFKCINVATGGKALQYIWRDDAQTLSKRVFSGSTVYTDNKLELFNGDDLAYFRPSGNTYSVNTFNEYTENGVAKGTVWNGWADFSSSTASSFGADWGPSSTVSGLLRANTNYEFTYSIFDKTLNYETNVGEPAKLRTSATDYQSFFIKKQQIVSGTPNLYYTPSLSTPFITSSLASTDWYLYNINFREFRVYYREEGTFEWLPAGVIPCAEALYTPESGEWYLCSNPIAGTPGGQPGGFIDYSPLPAGEYIDTVSFANRVFWMSKNQLHFSLQNNPLAFPTRNAVACPTGDFVGMIPHAYPGQAEQGARLVIFGSREVYTARFIPGAETQQRVRIGPNDAATFPVDGSNFIIDVWTSITAFSGRSAIVGDGILYYWGPQGIYRDNGVDIPVKISDALEPWIDDIYDANNTDLIHAVYNQNTDEAIWFYQPNTDGGAEQASRALVYHAKQRSWTRWEFNDLVIDNAQVVDDTKWDTDNDRNAGTRIIVGVRDPGGTVSRPMFLDEVIFAGDMQSDSMYMVKTVTHTDATTRRLTFAAGPTSIASKTGTAVIAGWQKYTGNTTTNPDGIYTITASGADYIEITRQGASADIPAGSYNENEYFPIWLGSTQSIAIVLRSQYWAPRGMRYWGRWLYSHTSYYVDLTYDQPGTSYDIPVQYYSLPGTDYSTKTITLSDNSRGNCQILNSIPYTKDNASGQAMAIDMTLTHYAGEWKLQYLGFDVAPEDVANIRYWEG